MHLIFTIFFACNNSTQALSTISVNGVDREYLLYVPTDFDIQNEAPVFFNFHGFGGTAQDQMEWSDFRDLADEHQFLLVYPQGSDLNGTSHWNNAFLGGDNKSTADDFGFTLALLDSLIEEYSVDEDRVYASGYSNGGFMSYSLVCYYSNRFTGIASVSSTMLNDFDGDCAPERPIPIISMNGTEDSTVPYNGGVEGFQAIPDVLNYWAGANNTDSTPTTSEYSDNGTSIERSLYEGGDEGISIDHYKVNGGEHIWFDHRFDGTHFNEIIWDFLSSHDMNGLREE